MRNPRSGPAPVAAAGSPAAQPSAFPVRSGARAGGGRFRWRALAAGVGATLVLACGLLLAVARHEPPALRRSVGPDARGASADDSERLAGRLISKASALHSAASRPGRWEGVFTEDELNAWLATDLPRNHPRLLPPGWSDPRVSLEPRHVWVGTRWHAGPLSALVWVRADVRVRAPGEIAVAVADAGLGGLPLPGDALLKQFGERLSAAGMNAAVARLDGRNQLVVRMADGGSAMEGAVGGARGRGAVRIDSLRLDDGEILVAGETLPGAAEDASR